MQQQHKRTNVLQSYFRNENENYNALCSVSMKMRTITNEKTKTKNLGKTYSNIVPTRHDTAMQMLNWLLVFD